MLILALTYIQQPPEGAMSFREFVRSRSDDVRLYLKLIVATDIYAQSEMNMLKTVINRLLENEDQTAQTRESIYSEMTQGKINASDGFLSLLGNDRSASCQRIGFLTGYATAIGMESEILRKVQASFAGNRSYVPNPIGMAGRNGDIGNTNSGEEMTETSEATEDTEFDSADETNGGVEANATADRDGTGDENAPVTVNGANYGDGTHVGGGVVVPIET